MLYQPWPCRSYCACRVQICFFCSPLFRVRYLEILCLLCVAGSNTAVPSEGLRAAQRHLVEIYDLTSNFLTHFYHLKIPWTISFFFLPIQHITGTYQTGCPAASSPASRRCRATTPGWAAGQQAQPPAPETPLMSWSQTTTWEATTLTATALLPTWKSSWAKTLCRHHCPPTRTSPNSICRLLQSPATAPSALAATGVRIPDNTQAKTSLHTIYLQRMQHRWGPALPWAGQQQEMRTLITVFLQLKT